MDPLSTTASTIAIIGFTGQSCQYLCKFLDTVSHAPREIRQHVGMLKALSSTFAAIEDLGPRLPADMVWSHEFCAQLSDCMADFRAAESKVKKLNERLKKGHMQRTWARVKWFSSDQYLRGFFTRLQTYHATFSLHLLTINIKLHLTESLKAEPNEGTLRQSSQREPSSIQSNPVKSQSITAHNHRSSTVMTLSPLELRTQRNFSKAEPLSRRDTRITGESIKSGLPLTHMDHPDKPNQNGELDTIKRICQPSGGTGCSTSPPTYNYNLMHVLHSQMELVSVRSAHLHSRKVFSVKTQFWHGPTLVKRWSVEQNQPRSQVMSSSLGYGAAVRILTAFGQITLSLYFFQKAHCFSNQSASIRCNLSFARVIKNDAAIFRLAQAGDILGMKSLFQNGKASPTDVTTCGITPLHIAAKRGSEEMAKFLIQEGADVNSPDEDGEIPLHGAIAGAQSFDVARILIDSGTDLMHCNVEGKTPLHTFFNPIVRTIFQYYSDFIEEAARDSDGMTLLHFAAWSSKSCCHLFKRHVERRGGCFASDIGSKDCSGRTVLHYAAQRGNIRVVEYILGLGDIVDVNLLDCDGRSALSYAAEAKRGEVIDMLHLRGSSVRDPDFRGRTPLHHAARRGNLAAVEKLVSLGSSEDVWLEDHKGATALQLAGPLGVASVMNRLEELQSTTTKKGIGSRAESGIQQPISDMEATESQTCQQDQSISEAQSQSHYLSFSLLWDSFPAWTYLSLARKVMSIAVAALLWESLKMALRAITL